MTPESRAEIRTAVLGALASVAPEADGSTLDPEQPLREQLDLDSMDFLNFAVALHAAFGVDVPERDYAKIASLDGCIDYIASRRSPP
jgi:acyl carrier protein